MAHDVVYYVLSTLEGKSQAVLDLLVEVVASGDGRSMGRALWGLGHGVPEDFRPGLAAELARRLQALPEELRAEAAQIARRYGG